MKPGKIVLLATAVIVAGIGSYMLYWEKVQHRFTVVTEHQLYQSAQMRPDELLELARDKGIRTVVDLRLTEDSREDIAAQAAALAGTDVENIHLPVEHVPDEASVMRFLEIVGDPSKRPVLVHCQHGTGRSVLFSSLFRLEFENWDNETARRAVEPLHWRGNFAPDAPKGAYLLEYQPREMKLVITGMARAAK